MAVRSVWMVLGLLCLAASEEDWSNCPSICKCKWFSGRKAAECTNASLTTIPSGLSAEIQLLDLNGNRIPALLREAFRSVGLVNLHKAYLKDCEIEELHKDAFYGLSILIELDLSGNRIHVLHPGTFKENVRLRILYLNRNPIQKLVDGIFSNLDYLQTVEMSECHLAHIGHKAFMNVPLLQTLRLDRNNLTNMKPDTLKSMGKLKSLELHGNPWNCDCHLKAFRDWIIEHNLYAQPTSCFDPPSLHGRLWTELESGSLACKPQIVTVVPSSDIKVDGGNVTMSCQVLGNPTPTVYWVHNSRIIGNTTIRKNFNDRLYVVRETNSGPKWVNLTIVDARHTDDGDYTCVAKNPGGMEELKLRLEVQNGAAGSGSAGFGGSINDTWYWILFLAVGALLLLIIVLVLSYCFCRTHHPRTSNKKLPNDGVSSNGDLSYHSGGPVSEQEKSLITIVNPVQKPPRRYESLSSSTANELEMKATLLDNGSVFIGPSVADSEDQLQDRSLDSLDTIPQRSHETVDADSGRPGAQTYPPDLLSFPSRGSQVSPAGSSASTAPDHTRLPAQMGPQSPLHSPPFHPQPHLFGTLPYSRSQSPFSPPPASAPRQGYVTIPRRPRVPSWSSAPTPTMVIDPITFKLEPVYDNLGPRTTADGSSVLSLNKTEQSPAGMRGRPLPPTPTFQNTLPAYYSPIAPIEEQPSPALPRANTARNLQRSTPNISTLSPEQAKPPPKQEKSESGGRQRGSWARIAPEGASLKRHDEDPSTSVTPASQRGSTASTASSPPLNGSTTPGRSGKVPPKPPPKPKKKTDSVTGPLYEDEGEDGTEV